jgi:hypothetical protein
MSWLDSYDPDKLKAIPKMPRAWLLSRYRGYWHEAVLVRVRVLSRAGLVFGL